MFLDGRIPAQDVDPGGDEDEVPGKAHGQIPNLLRQGQGEAAAGGVARNDDPAGRIPPQQFLIECQDRRMGLRGRMERQQRIIGCHDATSSHVGPFGERLPVLLREIVTVPSAVEIQENWLRIVCGIRLEDLHAVHAIFPHRPGELDSCRNQNGPFVRQIRLVSFVLLQVQCPEADDLVHEEGLRGPAVEQFDTGTGKQEHGSDTCQRPKEFLQALHRLGYRINGPTGL